MRKIIAFNHVSADGYFATADDALTWTVPEPALDQRAAAASQSRAGTILFGRRTYDMFESFWPNALGDAARAPDPHRPGRGSTEMRAMAVWINAATKVVFSKTRTAVTWQNSRLLHAIDPAEITALKQQPGDDILVFGSGSVASQLTEHGLIDEYQFVVAPILLGAGRSLLSGIPQSLRVDLLEAKSYPSGNVMLRYARQRS
jgi:dihydrofolate reductase